MLSILNDIGYNVLEPKIYKTIYYNVPQKRERVLIIGIRNDIYNLYNKNTHDNNVIINNNFIISNPSNTIYTLKDALKKGKLYDTDVPISSGIEYSKNKKEILSLIPQGGNWKNLSPNIQKKIYGQILLFIRWKNWHG